MRARLVKLAGLLGGIAIVARLRITRNVPLLLQLAGAGMIAYGAALIYLPAGFIAGGVELAAMGTLLDVASAPPRPAPAGGRR